MTQDFLSALSSAVQKDKRIFNHEFKSKSANFTEFFFVSICSFQSSFHFHFRSQRGQIQCMKKERRKMERKPILSQHDVYRKLMSVKKPNSSVEGDIPKKLVKQYRILRYHQQNASTTHLYPQRRYLCRHMKLIPSSSVKVDVHSFSSLSFQIKIIIYALQRG